MTNEDVFSFSLRLLLPRRQGSRLTSVSSATFQMCSVYGLGEVLVLMNTSNVSHSLAQLITVSSGNLLMLSSDP